jgi:hypothetical protein
MPPAISKLNDSGGLMSILSPIGVVLIVVLIYLMTKCFKSCLEKSEKFRRLVNKVHKIVFFNMIVRIILTGFLPIVVSSGLGNNFGQHLESEANWP